MEQSVNILCEGERVIVCLSGEIDHHSAKSLRDETDAEMYKRRPKELWIDFSGVRFMDSSGIGFIIGRAALASEIGCTVHISGLSETQKKLVKLSGIEKISNVRTESEGR